MTTRRPDAMPSLQVMLLLCAPSLLAALAISDDFARKVGESGLLRPAASRALESGWLWSGPEPGPEYSPVQVIELTLSALRSNDEPQPSAGTALLRRFSTADFALPGEPTEPERRLTPQDLTKFFCESQYGLLLDGAYRAAFPSDTVELDEDCAWQEVGLEAPEDGELLAKLGWSLRRRSDGCWLTDAVSWHDFRTGFRPGIGEEEWDRSFG